MLCLNYHIISLTGIAVMHLKQTREQLIGGDFISGALLREAQGPCTEATVFYQQLKSFVKHLTMCLSSLSVI